MLALTLAVMLAAEPASRTRAEDDRLSMSLAGLSIGIAAAAMTVAIPFADPNHTGTSDPALALAASAFWLVAAIRPFVFFTGQGAKPAKSALADVLRVIGSLTAVGGLASFIAYGVMRATHSTDAGLALIPTAGLEAISALAFSVDVLTASPGSAEVTPTVSALPSRGGVSVSAGLSGRF